MKFLIRFVVVIFCFQLMSCYAQDNSIQNVSTTELQTLVKSNKVQLLDVRTLKEVTQGKIGSAIHADFYQKNLFKEKIKSLDKTKPIYVYCHSGVRSKKASKILLDSGFKKVYNYSGGWKAWNKTK